MTCFLRFLGIPILLNTFKMFFVTCLHAAESAFLKFIFTGKGTLEIKISCFGVDSNRVMSSQTSEMLLT